MKTVIAIFASLAAIGIFAHPANADELTTGQLISFCSAKDDLPLAACRFFILGATEGLDCPQT